MGTLNLTNKHEINGFWTLYLEDENCGEYYGLLSYELGKATKIKLICERTDDFRKIFGKIKGKYLTIIGKTSIGTCYSFECLQPRYNRNADIYEIYLFPNPLFFIDKSLQKVFEKDTPQSIKTKSDTSFKKCIFKFNDITGYFYRCVAYINQHDADINKIIIDDKKGFSEIFSLATDDFSLTITFDESHSYNSFLDYYNRNGKFVFDIDFKKEVSIDEIIQYLLRIKSVFGFLAINKLLFEEITMYRDLVDDNNNEFQEECSILIQQSGQTLFRDSALRNICCSSIEEFNYAFKQLYGMANYNFQKMLALLNIWENEEDFFSSIVKVVNSIDENYKVLCDYKALSKNRKSEKKEYIEALKSSDISEEMREAIIEIVKTSNFMNLRPRLEFILNEVREYKLLNIPEDLEPLTKAIVEVRNADGHGRALLMRNYSDEEFDTLSQYRNIIYACVYIQLMKKIKINDSIINEFIYYNFTKITHSDVVEKLKSC